MAHVQILGSAAAAEPTPPQAGGSWLSRLLPLIALVALAALAWQLLTQRPDTDRIIDQEIDESVLVPGTGDTKLQGPPRDESLE